MQTIYKNFTFCVLNLNKAHVSYSDHDKFKYRDLMLSNAPFVIYFHNSVTVLTLSFHFDFFFFYLQKGSLEE